MKKIYQTQEKFILSSIPSSRIYSSLKCLFVHFSKTKFRFHCYSHTCCPHLPMYLAHVSSLIHTKRKVAFTQTQTSSQEKHAKYLSNPPSTLLSPFSSSTQRKRTYTKILQNCQYAYNNNQQDCITDASHAQLLKPHLPLELSSTHSIGVNITVYGNCFNPHLLTRFDDLPHKK